MNVVDWEEAAHLVKGGGVGVIPTDTIYGVVASAFNKLAVEKIFEVKGRDSDSRLIVLINSADQLAMFGVEQKGIDACTKYWPDAISIDLAVGMAPDYLLRGHESLAFRIPKHPELQDFIASAGPIVAPSANHQGEDPATDVNSAYKYFEDNVDFYVEGGFIKSEPSTLITIKDGAVEVLRQGKVDINDKN